MIKVRGYTCKRNTCDVSTVDNDRLLCFSLASRIVNNSSLMDVWQSRLAPTYINVVNFSCSYHTRPHKMQLHEGVLEPYICMQCDDGGYMNIWEMKKI